MIAYTEEEVYDLLEIANCKEDVQHIMEYVDEFKDLYDVRVRLNFMQSLLIMVELFK